MLLLRFIALYGTLLVCFSLDISSVAMADKYVSPDDVVSTRPRTRSLEEDGSTTWTLTANANFGGYGSIVFIQASDSSLTTMEIDLTDLPVAADSSMSYHVHESPVPAGLVGESPEDCALTNGHFDPSNLEAGESYDCPGDAPDLVANCALGDLSGKFGALVGPHNHQTHVDPNLPLFGSRTIIGRAITIHAADSSRLMCATVEFGLPTVARTASIANGGVKGEIRFEQAAGYPSTSPTTILVNLEPEDENNESEGHMWHIHEDAMAVDDGSDCASAGGHYDPLATQPAACSAELADSLKKERCEVGDLSGKHGLLDLPSTNLALGDANLPLSGPGFSLARRSVVVHDKDQGGGRKACANVVAVEVGDDSSSSSSSDDDDVPNWAMALVGALVVLAVLAIASFCMKRCERNAYTRN